MINKYIRKPLARKNGNKNPIWSWNNSLLISPIKWGRRQLNNPHTATLDRYQTRQSHDPISKIKTHTSPSITMTKTSDQIF